MQIDGVKRNWCAIRFTRKSSMRRVQIHETSTNRGMWPKCTLLSSPTVPLFSLLKYNRHIISHKYLNWTVWQLWHMYTPFNHLQNQHHEHISIIPKSFPPRASLTVSETEVCAQVWPERCQEHLLRSEGSRAGGRKSWGWTVMKRWQRPSLAETTWGQVAPHWDKGACPVYPTSTSH